MDEKVRKARHAAAQRLRRQQASPDTRAREAAAKRQKRQADAELRAREAAAKRQRRQQATPETRAQEAAAKRQRRQQAATPETRAREAAAKRQRRQQVATPGTGGADARFKHDSLDRSFGQSCKVAGGCKEGPATPKADKVIGRLTNADVDNVRKAKPVRRKARLADQQRATRDEEEDGTSSHPVTEVPCDQPQNQLLSRSKTSTPLGTPRPPSASADGQQQTTPLPSSSGPGKAPSPLPASLAPPAITKVEPGLASAAQGGATPPLKGLVDELVQLCHEEDLIRLQTAAVEQNIASVTLVLEELKKKRVELLSRESQVRKARLERLECLQGVASLHGGQPLPFTDHAQAFPIKTEILASFGGSSDRFSFLVTPSASAAPTVSSTQDFEKHLMDHAYT
ncbi:stress response protein NST1-like isoform X1 [Ixodes scapularis]|uniref:stress response protein NST1-like isoform X1 n=1 Tax=Ixodes scapularis TaxID=6945 RepID=UPI001C388E1D|nr:stress response protein NST1-like isoform X1 [Ixodes scapularis]